MLLELAVNVAEFSPWIVGVLLSGALAAAMSTGANLAHTASTVLTQDLFVRVFRDDMPERMSVRLTKYAVVVVSALAYVLALWGPVTIVQLFLIAYGAVLQFLPLTIATFFWRRATRAGALSGLIVGLLVTVYFTFLADPWFDVEAGLWGMLANIALLVVVSLLTKPMATEHLAKFVAGAEPETESAAV